MLRQGDANNYEMSDREESDEEEEEEEDEEAASERAKKRVPDWAHGPELAAAIHKQYGGEAIDPDLVFPEVHTCDLEAIFATKKKRFTKRTSSGNWHTDRLRDSERAQYRKDAGYTS